MSKRKDYILRKRKRKFFQDTMWINNDRMPYYSSPVISLYACGETVFLPGFLHEHPIKIPYWSIAYVCEGKYTVIYPDGKLQLTAGDILIHYPVTICRGVNNGSRPVKIKQFMLNRSPLISILCSRSAINGRKAVRIHDPAAVEVYFDRIRELIADPSAGMKSGHALQDMIFSLFMEIISQCGEMNLSNSFEDRLRQLNVFSPDLTLEKIAEHFKTGKCTLNRRFKRHLNLSPFQYVIAMRMKYAAQLLGSNTFSIKEIAEECGYKNTSFFIAEFKKYFQKTPLEYRNSKATFDNQKIHLLDGWNRMPKNSQ